MECPLKERISFGDLKRANPTMKMNIYTTTAALAMLCATSGFAQLVDGLPRHLNMEQLGVLAPARPIDAAPAASEREGGDVVFSEDFANGLAGNNGGVGAWTTTGSNGNIWKRKVTGPLGAFTVPAQRIASTTVSNGYMLFNGDSVNCTWAGNVPTAIPDDEFFAYDGSLESPALDLSATPFVEIQFQQRLRYCCFGAPNFLEISTDGGLSWPTRFNTAAGIEVNGDPGTPTIKFNLSNAIEANLTNVKFRFHHDAAPGSSHYYWQIDDIKIVELYEFDLRLTSSSLTTWVAAQALTYDSLRYSIYPFSQLRPIGLNMSLLNIGVAEQTDAVANFTVQRQGGAVVLDQDQNIASLATGAADTVFVDPSFTPPAEAGTYDISYSVTSGQVDQMPDDNNAAGNFEVDPFVYARDGGTIQAFEDGNGDGGTLVLGNGFFIGNGTELHGIAIALRTGSEIGALIVGQLRDASNGDFPVLESTEEVAVTASMLGANGSSNFTVLRFPSPVTLEAGSDFIVSVECFGNVRIGISGTSEPQSSYIFYDGQSGLDWYFTTSTPMIRMSFDPSVGLEELGSTNGVTLLQNQPNPARENTTLTYTLEEARAISFEIRDVSGKLVQARYEGNKAPGQHRVELDTQALGEGVYFYTMTAGDVRLSKRMTVIH